MESKSKKQFQYRVRIDFSLQQFLTVSSFHNLVEKGAMTLPTAMSGGSFWECPPTLPADSFPSKPAEIPKNTGVGSLSLLQGILPTQELNWGLLN